MKIKINKYIFYYGVLLVLSFIFYINFNFFKSFFSNFGNYLKLYNLKKTNPIELKKYDITGDFSILDISNIKLLNKDFSGAKSMIYNTNQYSYKDFYNLGNIYLLQSYYFFGKNTTGVIDLVKKSLAFYNTSLESIPSYKSKTYILSNLNIAQGFLNFLYVYNCDSLFLNMIQKIHKINLLISDILYVLKKQHDVLDKWAHDKDLKECILSFKNSADKNIYLIYDTKDFFSNVSKGLLNTLKDFQQDEITCNQKKALIKAKYEKSIDSSYTYYKKFLKTQKNLLEIFEKANKFQMEFLCKHKQKLAQKQNKENQKMKKNFDNLRDLTQKNQKPQRKKSPNKQDHEQADKKNNKKNNMLKDNEELNKSYSKKIQSLEEQNKNLIEQIQREKTQDNYDPLKYLKNLFKEFYANEKDFIEGKKQNSIGK